MIVYKWSRAKAASNLAKHRISFYEAITVFLDPLALTFTDAEHSFHERREITIGNTMKGRLLFVVHTAQDNQIRIISARRANRSERRLYEGGEESE